MKLEKLEALRGFAAIYVVLHHTLPPSLLEFNSLNLKFLLRFGQEAVILFFLLSGFVIHYAYQRSTDKSFKTYFSKRALRIYIPLLAVFLIAYLIECNNAGRFIDPRIYNLAQNIFMLQDWEKVKPNVLAEPYMNNTPLWSLSYEWWFYMLYFPIINFFRNSKRLHASVFGATILAAIVYAVFPYFVPRLILYLGIWWTGVYIADLYLQKKTLTLNTTLLPIVSLILISMILSIQVLVAAAADQKLLLGFHPVLEVRHTLFALFAVIGALIWKSASWFGFNLLLKPFALLAPISYTVYISHVPIMENSSFFEAVDNSILRWGLYLTVMLVFAYLVEQVLYKRLRALIKSDVKKLEVV